MRAGEYPGNITDQSFWFNFNVHESGETDAYDKLNDSSFYVNAVCDWESGFSNCTLHANGLIRGKWMDCTNGGAAFLNRSGEFLIYNQVYELQQGKTSAKLGGYRTGSWNGFVGGVWSSDSIDYGYPVLNP